MKSHLLFKNMVLAHFTLPLATQVHNARLSVWTKLFSPAISTMFHFNLPPRVQCSFLVVILATVLHEYLLFFPPPLVPDPFLVTLSRCLSQFFWFLTYLIVTVGIYLLFKTYCIAWKMGGSSNFIVCMGMFIFIGGLHSTLVSLALSSNKSTYNSCILAPQSSFSSFIVLTQINLNKIPYRTFLTFLNPVILGSSIRSNLIHFLSVCRTKLYLITVFRCI